MAYYIGDVIKLYASFRNQAYALSDPSSVNLEIVFNTTTYNYALNSGVTRLSLGNYAFSFNASSIGAGVFAWTGSGHIVGSRGKGSFRVLSASDRPDALLAFDTLGDHIVVDGLEKIIITQRNGVSIPIEKALRLQTTGEQSEGSIATFGASVSWNIWTIEMPEPPQINALITDAFGRKYRISRVTNSVLRAMWEIDSVADAGEMK